MLIKHDNLLMITKQWSVVLTWLISWRQPTYKLLLVKDCINLYVELWKGKLWHQFKKVKWVYNQYFRYTIAVFFVCDISKNIYASKFEGGQMRTESNIALKASDSCLCIKVTNFQLHFHWNDPRRNVYKIIASNYMVCDMISIQGWIYACLVLEMMHFLYHPQK